MIHSIKKNINKQYSKQYHYSQLSCEHRSIYRTLIDGVMNFNKSIKLPLKPINEITGVFEIILIDNPLIFYISSYHYSIDRDRKEIIFNPDYKFSEQSIQQSYYKIFDFLQEFNAIKQKSNLEKEIYVHDFFLNHFTYDYSLQKYAHSVLGIVYNKTAVCEGIAKTIKLVLDYLEMNSLVVKGKAKSPALGASAYELHAWNIVMLEDKYCHLDVTFDISIKTCANRYDYFNLNDDDIKKDHILSSIAPSCKGIKDFFETNGLIANNPNDLKELVYNALKQSRRRVYVKLRNVKHPAQIANKVIMIAQQQYENLFLSSASVELHYNLEQSVFEIYFR